MRLVIIGYGYSSQSIAQYLNDDIEDCVVTCRSFEKAGALKAHNMNAVLFDGTQQNQELNEALHSATHLLISAPPNEAGDPFLLHYREALAKAQDLQWIGYLSTVGVYGHHDGHWVSEETPCRPRSHRSKMRYSVEKEWLRIERILKIPVGVFRLSGIYGSGRSVIDKLRKGTARRIIRQGQVFNRIHVEDIGRVVAKAAKQRYEGILNITDYLPAPPQDVVAYGAKLLNMEPPPEIAFKDAKLSPMGRSFYSENKRVRNHRIAKDLEIDLLYPSYKEGLKSLI